MNSDFIVKNVANILIEKYQTLVVVSYDYHFWHSSFILILDDLKIDFYERYKIELPELKSDALYLIMNDYFLKTFKSNNIMLWDKHYVREKYAINSDGCHSIYYPSTSPKRLIINFSSMGFNRFDRYSRYWDKTEKWNNDTAYLFLKDDDFSYYIGNKNKKDTYLRLIKKFIKMNKLTNDDVFMIGSSMGGYAALYYGLLLQIKGVLISSPQINLSSTYAHKYDNWSRSILDIGPLWKDLDMMVHSVDKLPFIYVEYGNYMADVLAVESLLEQLRKKESLIIISKMDWKEHAIDNCLPQEKIDKVICLFEVSNV